MPVHADSPAHDLRQAVELALEATSRTGGVEAGVEHLQSLRGRGRERSLHIDSLLLEHVRALTRGLGEAREHQRELRELTAKVLAPPWFPATFLRLVPDGDPPRALVAHGGAFRVIGFDPALDPAVFAAGDDVLLSHELHLIVGRPGGHRGGGEIAEYRRRLADGRLVVRARDEEFVVEAGAAIGGDELTPGDPLCWDRQAYLARERLERRPVTPHLLSGAPPLARDQLGGDPRLFDLLLSTLTAQILEPDAATRYGLGGRQSVLLCGPPGCGKTLMVRLAAAEMTRLSGRPCPVAVVKPAAWESPWVGETQRNIRECFASMRQLADEQGMALLFLDEIEAIGRLRGGAAAAHSDKFLAALLAELDGFAGRGAVAVLAATNRKDLVDPALLERLSDVEIPVRRPDLRAARQIFAIHLPPWLPYSPNGDDAQSTRQAMIDTAVARFYSPEGDNDLCILRLRDGSTRTVVARELASGRTFEQVCRAARRAALLRDLRHREAGLRVEDIEDAARDAFDRLASTLSPRNAHAYLPDLPQDVDVVGAEPLRRRVARPHRYLNTEPQRSEP